MLPRITRQSCGNISLIYSSFVTYLCYPTIPVTVYNSHVPLCYPTIPVTVYNFYMPRCYPTIPVTVYNSHMPPCYTTIPVTVYKSHLPHVTLPYLKQFIPIMYPMLPYHTCNSIYFSCTPMLPCHTCKSL